jgi:cytochrome c oxidase subunit I+III
LPPSSYPVLAAGLVLASSAAIAVARRFLRGTSGHARITLCIATGLVLLCTAIATEIAGQWRVGWRPDQSGYAALVGMNIVLQGQLVAGVAIMGLFAIARRWAGRLDTRRRAVFDNVRLLWLYAVAQSLFGLLLVHGFPRAV